MDRRGWFTAGAAALGLAVVALVASSEPVKMFHEPTTTEFPEFDLEPAPLPGDGFDGSPAPNEGFNVPLLTPGLERAAIVVLLLLLASYIVYRARRWFTELEPEDPQFDVLPDVRAALADAAEAQRQELLSGSPRNAIVACWVRLEDVIEQAGLPRNRAETSTELTTRVLSTYVVDRSAIDTLAALYREARFSVHELEEAHRQQAIAALDELYAQLRRPRANASSTP
jgi:hypothetical protein